MLLAGSSLLLFWCQAATPAPSPRAYRAVYQVEDFWGMKATADQWNQPVEDGWTWFNYDLWQVPRREEGIFGAGILLNGGTAITCAAGGELWQEITVPRDAVYRLFARVIDYRKRGVNSVSVKIDDDETRRLEWGPSGPLGYAAPVLARLRPLHDLADWLEVGSFSLGAGNHRLSVTAEEVGQVFLAIDAFYLTEDQNEGPPTGRDPRAFPPEPHGRPVKTRRTLCTDAEIATARTNVERYEWARRMSADVFASASRFIELSYDELWYLMPSTSSRRATSLASGLCPEHRRAVNRDDGRWQIEPFGHPRKLKCPVGGEWQRVEALGSFENPDIATEYYNHQVFVECIRPGVETLGKAYALSGDARYARAAGIILTRVALEYPDAFDNKGRAFRPPYSGTSGTVTDNVQSGHDLPAFAAAYDYVFDVIDRDEELIKFLGSRIAMVQSGGDLRWYIEEHLLRKMARAVLDGAIFANPGIHDRGLMAVAVCLDDFEGDRFPNSMEMIDWLFFMQHSRGFTWSQPRRYVSNYLLPDGCSDASVDYNSLNLFFIDFAEWLERARELHPEMLPPQRYPSLFASDRLRRQVDFLTKLVCLGRYHPANGDGHGKKLWEGDNLTPRHFEPDVVSLAYPSEVYKLFRRRPDAELARLLWEMGAGGHSLYHDIFDVPRDDQIKSLAQSASPAIGEETSLLDDYGMVILRSGAGDSARALWVNYNGPQNGEHRNADRLNIGMFAKGLDLMPELPYPKSWAIETVNNFERHPLLHNTITFDRRPTQFESGWLEQLGRGPGIQVLTARSESANGFSVERTIALIDAGDNSYAVDVTRGRGGSEHHLSFHAPIAPTVTVSGVDLNAKPGTLAGDDKKYGDRMARHAGMPSLHPFSFMSEVERGPALGIYRADYRLGDERDTHIRVTGVPESAAEVILADARPPGDPDAYRLRYLLAHRQGSAPLVSQFVNVYEPYSGKPFIDRVERVGLKDRGTGGNDPVAIRIVIGSRTDTLVLNPEADRVMTADKAEIAGRFCFFSETGGPVQAVFLCGGGYFRKRGVSIRGNEPVTQARIVAVDRTSNSILIKGKSDRFARLRNRWVRVFNGDRSRMYRVLDVRKQTGGLLRLALDRSALVGEGEAIGIAGNALLTNLSLPFVSRGCTVENREGSAHWRLKRVAHRGHSGSDLVLRPFADSFKDREVEKDFENRTFFVYGYGPGDTVELTSVAVYQNGGNSDVKPTTSVARVAGPLRRGGLKQ